jgi:phosphonate transport system substrate-binding protein
MTTRSALVAVLCGLVPLAVGSPVHAREAAGEGVRLRLGVMAEEPTKPDKLIQVYDALLSVLRARLAPGGIRVGELLICRDVEDLAAALRRGDADFVIETVFPTLLLRRRSGALEPALVVVRRGDREYRSVFFARKDDPIRTLKDLRGRTLVLQALRSTSAFALPRAELLREGLSLVPADHQGDPAAVRYSLAGAEINQAFWVANGRGDAGAFNRGDWDALPAGVRDRLRIFHETRPMLRGLLSFRTGLAARVRAAVEQALLGLHEDTEGARALQQAVGITRFERLTPQDRAGLRSWEGVLGPIAATP